MPERAGGRVTGEDVTVAELLTSVRCKCDQYGRCLTDCPSADLVAPAPGWYWNRTLKEWIDRG